MTRLIDADALNTYDVSPAYGMTVIGLTEEDIELAPTVDAVPVRRGRWLSKHRYIAGHEFVSGHICSECGDDALNAEGDEFLTDYCPNCGADMRGEDG